MFLNTGRDKKGLAREIEDDIHWPNSGSFESRLEGGDDCSP